MKRFLIAVALVLAVATPAGANFNHPQDLFYLRLEALCGKRFEGRVVSTDPADKDFAGKRLVMGVVQCSHPEVRIPFAVGEDHSRTWVITYANGFRLKHDHRHADGKEDVLSQYGGDTTSAGTATRQEFPADAFSKTLFQERGNPASVTNVWAVEVTDKVFVYELRRPSRHFRVEFDLTKPLP
eukprot:gene16792-16607_t